MSKISDYMELIEGEWNVQGLVFDFKTITEFPNTEKIKIIVTGELPESKSIWNGYLKEEKGSMLFIHSNEEFTGRVAEITKLNGTSMSWEIKSENHDGYRIIFNRI
jgi:hypothetical protein